MLHLGQLFDGAPRLAFFLGVGVFFFAVFFLAVFFLAVFFLAAFFFLGLRKALPSSVKKTILR